MINNLLDGCEVLPFLLNKCVDHCPFIVVCKECTQWSVACGREVDMGLHVGKVCEELVNLGEVGAAIEGVNIVGGERDRSGIGSGEGHVSVFTMVGVMS